MIDWHLVITGAGVTITVAVLVWKMGQYTGRLDSLVVSLTKALKKIDKRVKRLERRESKL